MFPCYSLNSFHPLLPRLCPRVCSLCLCLHCCPANRSTSTIFPDFIYMCWYTIFVFHFLIYFTLYNRLEKDMATHSSILVWKIPWTDEPAGLQSVCGFAKSRTRLTLTQTHSSVWLSNMPLCVCATTSVSIHLLMDIQVASISWLL